VKSITRGIGPAPLPAAWLAVCLIPCLAACLLCVAAAAAPTTRPAQPAQLPQGGRATTRPDTQPAQASAAAVTSPVRSEIGQAPIRRDAGRQQSPRDASQPAASQPNVPGFDLPKVAGALALVLGLIFALRWVLRRSMHGAGVAGVSNAVQVLVRSPLSPRQQLLLVRVGRRLLVVSDCNGQLNSLSEITDADEIAALVGQLRDEKLTSASRSFGNLLGRWRAREEPAGDGGDEVEGEEFPRAAPDVPDRSADGNPGDEDVGPSIASARHELNGLKERVRLLAHQFKRS
jgi:flagellar biogenesis protein FliO